MALRLPPQVPRRQHSYSTSQPPQPPTLEAPPRLSHLPDNESTEWVLFSPSQPSADARTHTTSTERTPRTVAPSRLSDFGSFGTPTRSAWGPDNDHADEPLEESLDEDGTELDSLDDGLHAFRAPSLNEDSSAKWDQGTPAVLPAHDGLGSFEASAQPVQDQLWQHEQYNPHRRPMLGSRRFSNVQRQLDSVEEHEAIDMDRERWQRIEKWRMDQSRVLLQEIEKETRKRRHSRAIRLGDPVGSQARVAGIDSTLEMPREDTSPPSTASDGDENESLWRKITRKVIRDLIGIDDSVLFALFGESLPESERGASAGTDDTLRMNETLNLELDSVPDDHDNWQTKLLQRIARELGILVNQLCEHPGAFTSYLNMSDEIPNQYAGMPLGPLPEESDSQARSISAAPTASQEPATNADSVLSPHFSPTLRDPAGREHAAQWGIEDDDLNRESSADSLSESVRLQQEKEYWERELDVMMVFRYIRNRFSQRGSNADTYQSPARRPPQDASRRAAIIRQHHPLVARAHSRSQAQVRRQSQHSTNQSGPTGISSPILRQHFRRPSSSCGQSAKLSAISSRRTLTGSSRNYWDIGGSVDSGSAIAPVGGVGSWGDV
ncbi:hypothetical protein BDV41DRAFT_527528 [Aspergillus transmontanensis]|uniref:Uncharacterized protein n=1 Tax=Aspergillus transmontanensis TaxID=1034304 RepID=A0A5N6W7X6_9EURO|nr:hypothetical protein BDV41DRAFT_527528 [Aspergillus transmontanensis]